MKYLEARVTLDHADPETASDLVAAVFFDFGLQGVVVEDPGLHADADWAEDALPRPQRHAVSGFLPADGQLESRLARLEEHLAALARRSGLVYRLSFREVDEEDWAESWKAFFQPLRIGRRLVVKPSWREAELRPGDLVIELDPGMAFGTGSHPTTRLSLELIERHLRPGGSFLDVGTGSGILLLAAAKLGAGRLAGCDRDENALRVARENLARNGIDPRPVALVRSDLALGFRGRFDLIAANILTEVVIRLLADVPRLLAPGGRFLASGMLAANRDFLSDRFRKAGLKMLEIRENEGWIALVARQVPIPA
ncbi:MAG: 50S ribosomal protein L11 methyltransferase [Desulfobacterales bacterium]